MSRKSVSRKAMAVVSSLLVMAVLMPVQAIAIQAYPVDGDVLAPYQAVIDELNETYGTEAAFVTYQESIDMGIPMPTPEHLGTVAEFRETLESFLVESLPISTAAQQAAAAAALAASEPPTEAVCTSVVRDSNGMIIEKWFEPVGPVRH
jgi:hypothetical protein